MFNLTGQIVLESKKKKKNLLGGKTETKVIRASSSKNKKDLLGGKSETEVAEFVASQILTKKKKKKLHRRFQVQLQSISVSILPKQRFISCQNRGLYCLCLSYLMLDHFSAFILLSW